MAGNVSNTTTDADRTYRLINGYSFQEGFHLPGLDFNDPIAVLALEILAGQKSELRRRAETRGSLVKQVESVRSDLETLKEEAREEKLHPDDLQPRIARNRDSRERNRERIKETSSQLKQAQTSTEDARGRLRAEETALAEGQRTLNSAEATLRSLRQSRGSHKQFLWWLGIGWIIWALTSGESKVESARRSVERHSRRQQELERSVQQLRNDLEGKETEQARLERVQADHEEERSRLERIKDLLFREEPLLNQLAEIDRQPLSLIRQFGYGHLPLAIDRLPAINSEKKKAIVRTAFLPDNFQRSVFHIPDGLRRTDVIASQIRALGEPILLSPTPARSTSGLKGEELALVRLIDAFSALVDSAERIQIALSLIDPDIESAHQLDLWQTGIELPPAQAQFLTAPDFPAREQVTDLYMQVRREILNNEESLVKRLNSLKGLLAAKHENYSEWRRESISEILSQSLTEWQEFSLLPILSRYCPSFHRVPEYRYGRLGFRPEDVLKIWSENPEMLNRLPNPATVRGEEGEPMAREVLKRKLGDLDERIGIDETQYGTQQEGRNEGLKAEITEMVRRIVEGGSPVTLSEAAKLNYRFFSKWKCNICGGTNPPQSQDCTHTDESGEPCLGHRAENWFHALWEGYWCCGLCQNKYEIGGPGSPDEFVGCPDKGRFSHEEARLAEQYVHYQDLFMPMLKSLWNEKSTFDEINRIIREKEQELRSKALTEMEALRKEALYFKEAARDRVIVLEEVSSQAKEIVTRLREQINTADRLGTLPPGRKRELADELSTFEQSLSEVGEIRTTTQRREDDLALDADMVLKLRPVQLEEKIRRGSDAPEFRTLPSKTANLLFVKREQALLPSGDETLMIRKKGGEDGAQEFYLSTKVELRSWAERDRSDQSIEYEIYYGDSWVDLEDYVDAELPGGELPPPVSEGESPSDS